MGGGEHDGACRAASGAKAVVHLPRREQAERTVVVFMVVPVEQVAGAAACVLGAAEAIGEFRAVLQRLEVRLAEWVVIRYVRPTVSLGDAEVGVELRHRLA